MGWRRKNIVYVLLLLGIISWIMLLDDIWLPLLRLVRKLINLPKSRRRREIDVERGEPRRLILAQPRVSQESIGAKDS